MVFLPPEESLITRLHIYYRNFSTMFNVFPAKKSFFSGNKTMVFLPQ